MTDDLTNYAKDLAAQNAPWSEGVRWWIVLIQAVILLGLGLFVLFVPNAANKTVVELLGIFLLVAGIMDAFQGFSSRVTPRALPYHMLSAGSAITVGLIVILDLWQDFMSIQAAAVVVSTGLLIYGIMGLLIWIGGGERGDRTILNLILPVGAIALGGMALFTRLEMGAAAIRWFGIVALIIGALLLVQTFILYGKQTKEPEVVQQEMTAQATDTINKQIDAAQAAMKADVDEAAKKSDSGTG